MVTRIRQLLDWQQLSPTQFADLIGVGRPVVSHILSERNKPSLEVVQRVIAAFPTISLPWLLSGTGEMLAVASPESTSAPATAPVSGPPAATTSSPRPPGPPITASAAANAPTQASSAPRPTPAIRRPVAPAPTRFVVARPPLVAATPAAAPIAGPAALVEVLSPLGVAPASAATLPPSSHAEPASGQVASPVPEPETAHPLADELPATPATAEAVLPFLGEPGKAIRRIVIFYRDGSFADYLPEA